MTNHPFSRRLFAVLGLSILCIPTLVAANLEAQAHPIPQLNPQQHAEQLLGLKQYDQALDEYKRLVTADTEDSYLARGLVRAFQAADKMGEAESFLTGLLASHSSSSALNYGLGYYFYQTGMDARADEYFGSAVKSDPQNALAWNNWGALWARKKSYTQAVEKVREAIRLKPSEAMFFHNLSSIYDDMGEKGLFFAEFKGYLTEGDKSLAEGYGKVIAEKLRQEGFALYAQGKIDETIDKFKEMLEIYRNINYSSGVVPALFSLGLLYEEQGDLNRAEGYFREVLKINPRHIQAREKLKAKK